MSIGGHAFFFETWAARELPRLRAVGASKPNARVERMYDARKCLLLLFTGTKKKTLLPLESPFEYERNTWLILPVAYACLKD